MIDSSDSPFVVELLAWFEGFTGGRSTRGGIRHNGHDLGREHLALGFFLS